MTPDEYVLQTVSKYRLPNNTTSPSYQAALQIVPIIQKWAGSYLLGIHASGSFAKGTGIKGSSDIDLFISLNSDTPDSLEEIYEKLHNRLQESSLNPTKQNVSIGITYSGF